MKRKLKSLFGSGLFALSLLVVGMPQPVYAGTGSLTDLFKTQAFSGSMETISKLNWVGWLLSGIISVFCLVGLFLTVFRIMTSLMYLSGRNVFDKIHEIKSSNQGPVLGLPSLFKSAFNGGGNAGSGIDTFIYFFLGLLPDVKMYSDFAEGKEMRGVSQDTTVTEYILKTSIPTIMMIFFLAIGFSGTLWQMFGTVVDAMAVAAEKVATTNLDTQVERLLNADSYYKFGFGDDGTNWGKLEENMAKSIYNKVLSKSDSSIDGDYSLALGQVIGDYFTKGALTKERIAKICGSKEYANDDLEAKNIKYSVLINSISAASSENDVVIPFTDLHAKLPSVKNAKSFKSNLYIHVYVYRKESAIKTNYFSVKKNDSGKVEQSAPANANGIKGN